MSFRKNLEYLRKGRKLSQEELAFKLGVSRQSVSKWESGGAYPETEKMLAMCKLFDCTLDELMNQDIREENIEESRKYTFNDLLKEFTSIIDRTIRMLTSMNVRSTIRFVFEVILLFILILIMRLPFDYIYRAGSNIFTQISGEFFSFLLAFWRFIVDIVYLVVGAISFVYIYKVRFLDSFEEEQGEKVVNSDKSSAVKSESSISEKRISTPRYDFGVFSILGKIVLFFVKCFVFVCLLFLIFFFLVAVAGLVIEISWLLEGIRFWSILLFLLASIIFLGVLIKVMYNFIFNRKTVWQKIFTFLITTLVLFGVSAGVGALELKDFSVVEEYTSSFVLDKEVKEFPMKDTLIINPTYSIKYVEDEELVDKVRIEVMYLKKLVDIVMNESDGEGGYRIDVYTENKKVSLKEMYTLLLNDLRRKEIHSNYHYMFNGKITVYTSRSNIEKIKSNRVEQTRYLHQEPTCLCSKVEAYGSCECIPSL